MPEETTKAAKIIAYMKSEDGKNKGLTHLECFNMFGTYRLAHYIWVLRGRGWVFTNFDEEHADGIHTRYFTATIGG